MAKDWVGLPLLSRGSDETSGRRVDGCLRLSRARGLSAVEATPVARLSMCAKRIVRGIGMTKRGDAEEFHSDQLLRDEREVRRRD